MRGWITEAEAPGGVRLVDDLAEPEAGPQDVVVEVRASSINRGELSLVAARPHGFRPGQDVSGVVVRPAARGGPPAGARVVALVDEAAWGERVAVPRRHLAILPDGVPFADAATLPVAGLTALRALRSAADLLGRNVLVTGATGGVGRFAVELAIAAGARVTALVRQRQVEDARALGAHDVVTSLDGENLGPFHVVLDGVGGPTLVGALRRLAPGGTVAMYGVLGGKAEIDVFDFASCPNARLLGMFLHEPGDTSGEELATLAGLVARGRLRPSIGLLRAFSRMPEALAAMREGRVRGKAVLVRE